MLQGQIVNHAKEPPDEARSIATEAEVTVQREKRLLHDVLRFLDPEAKRSGIAQQLWGASIEQDEGLGFGATGRTRRRACGRRQEGGLYDRGR